MTSYDSTEFYGNTEIINRCFEIEKLIPWESLGNIIQSSNIYINNYRRNKQQERAFIALVYYSFKSNTSLRESIRLINISLKLKIFVGTNIIYTIIRRSCDLVDQGMEDEYISEVVGIIDEYYENNDPQVNMVDAGSTHYEENKNQFYSKENTGQYQPEEINEQALHEEITDQSQREEANEADEIEEKGDQNQDEQNIEAGHTEGTTNQNLNEETDEQNKYEENNESEQHEENTDQTLKEETAEQRRFGENIESDQNDVEVEQDLIEVNTTEDQTEENLQTEQNLENKENKLNEETTEKLTNQDKDNINQTVKSDEKISKPVKGTISQPEYMTITDIIRGIDYSIRDLNRSYLNQHTEYIESICDMKNLGKYKSKNLTVILGDGDRSMKLPLITLAPPKSLFVSKIYVDFSVAIQDKRLKEYQNRTRTSFSASVKKNEESSDEIKIKMEYESIPYPESFARLIEEELKNLGTKNE